MCIDVINIGQRNAMKKEFHGTLIQLIMHIGIFGVKDMNYRCIPVQKAQLCYPRDGYDLIRYLGLPACG